MADKKKAFSEFKKFCKSLESALEVAAEFDDFGNFEQALNEVRVRLSRLQAEEKTLNAKLDAVDQQIDENKALATALIEQAKKDAQSFRDSAAEKLSEASQKAAEIIAKANAESKEILAKANDASLQKSRDNIVILERTKADIRAAEAILAERNDDILAANEQLNKILAEIESLKKRLGV